MDKMQRMCRGEDVAWDSQDFLSNQRTRYFRTNLLKEAKRVKNSVRAVTCPVRPMSPIRSREGLGTVEWDQGRGEAMPPKVHED